MPTMARLSALLVAALLAAAAVPAALARAPPAKVGLSLLGSVPFPAAEQVAYDDKAKVAYVIGGSSLAVVDLPPSLLLGGAGGSPSGAALRILRTVDLGRSINDVAFCGDWLALALSGALKTDPGSVQLHRRYSAGAGSLELLATFPVGSLPDQLEFSKDCKTILVSNEGEPSGYGDPSQYVDPEGSVSIIRLKSLYGKRVAGSVRTADFRAWNGRRAELLAQGVKLNGPGASVAQDLEPECTTFSEDERTAFVSLQENNAIATLDVASGRITAIHPLGLKNHAAPANRMDASDKDDAVNIASWPVSGLFMPDELKSFRVGGVDFVVGANEGDARDWPGFAEEGNVNASKLDPAAFPNAAALEDKAALGRLTIVGDLNQLNDPDGDGRMERILSYGARSFSIWRLDRSRRTKRASLTRVYDSGSLLETITAAQLPALFNSEGTTDTKDKRSDNKGPEPEGVAVGPCGAGSRRRCLFLTTERLGAVFVFDITNPALPAFQSLALPPQFNAADEATRLKGPEGIAYASYTYQVAQQAQQAPRYRRRPQAAQVPLVLVAYEGADGSNGGLGVFRVGAAA